MKYQDLQTKSSAELTAQLDELRGKLHALRQSRSMGQLRDVREIREVRKDIARIQTKLSSTVNA